MKPLSSVLARLRRQKYAAGGTLSAAAIEALEAHRKTAARAFGVLFVAVVVGVVIAAYASIAYVRDPSALGVVAGALGLSLGGALELMRRTTREWNQASLLLILVSDAREDQVAALLDKLIGNI